MDRTSAGLRGTATRAVMIGGSLSQLQLRDSEFHELMMVTAVSYAITTMVGALPGLVGCVAGRPAGYVGVPGAAGLCTCLYMTISGRVVNPLQCSLGCRYWWWELKSRGIIIAAGVLACGWGGDLGLRGVGQFAEVMLAQ